MSWRSVPARRQTRAAWPARGRPPVHSALLLSACRQSPECARSRPQGGAHLRAGVFAVVGDGVRGRLAAQVLLVVDETCARALPTDERRQVPEMCVEGRQARRALGEERRGACADVVGHRRTVVGHKAHRQVGRCSGEHFLSAGTTPQEGCSTQLTQQAAVRFERGKPLMTYSRPAANWWTCGGRSEQAPSLK